MRPIFRFWGHHRNWSLHFVPMHAEVSTSAITQLLALGWSFTDNFHSNNYDGCWLYIYRSWHSSRLRIMAHREVSPCTSPWSKGKVPSRRFLYPTIDSCDEKVHVNILMLYLMIPFNIFAISFNSCHFYQILNFLPNLLKMFRQLLFLVEHWIVQFISGWGVPHLRMSRA